MWGQYNFAVKLNGLVLALTLGGHDLLKFTSDGSNVFGDPSVIRTSSFLGNQLQDKQATNSLSFSCHQSSW